MPKLTNKAPSYRRHKASGRAIVTLGARDVSLGAYGTEESRRAYKRIIGEYFANDGRLQTTPPTALPSPN
jgi:hypothetical protein